MKKAVILALALCLVLTGCSSGLTIFSNYRRLEMLELVRIVTVDTAEEGVSVGICGTAGEKQEARMYEKAGPSIGVALNELTLRPLGREAILSHTENMMVGEALAKTQFDEVLDYVERFSEMRLDTGILIVRDGTAKDLIYGLAGKETPASDVVAGLDRNIQRLGRGYVFSCREIASSLAQNGCALVQCVRGEKEEKLFEDRGDLNIAPAGMAVMRRDSVAGFLNDDETLGTMLILRKFRSCNLDIPVDGAVLTLSVDNVKPEIKPVFSKDGKLTRVEIRLRLQANLVSENGLADVRSRDVRERAESALSAAVRSACEAAVKKGPELGLDFLDLRGILTRKEPIAMEDMGESWDRIFPALPVTVEVESTLMRTYDIIDPPEISGREEGSPWEKLTDSLKDN